MTAFTGILTYLVRIECGTFFREFPNYFFLLPRNESGN